jgi:predicted phosphodiesterase
MPQVSCNAEWVTILSCEGNNKDGRIFFRIDENNDSGAERSAQIVVSYGDVTTTQNITQTLDASKINLVYGGQTCSYEEKTYSFTYSIENPRESITPRVTCNSQWITGLKDNNGTVSFTVLENNSGARRSDEILITYGNISARYFVQQEYTAPDIFLQADKEIFDYRTAESSILYHIENSRKNLMPQVSCNAEWVTILSCKGNNKEGRIFFRVNENNDSGAERSAQIVVSYGDVTTTQYITQTNDVPKITLVNGGQNCNYEEKTYSFTYNIENPRETITPRVSTYASWIKGLTINNGIVTFTVEENNSGASRSDEIKITYGNCSAIYFIAQTYTAPTVFFNMNSSDFDYIGGTGRIEYYIANSRKNIKLKLSCEASWVTDLRYNGDQTSGEILFNVSENQTSQDRSTYIDANYVVTSETHHIYQTGK